MAPADGYNQGAEPDAPLMPQRVGRYELLLPIASGGMATVFLGRIAGVAGFEREVAVKLTHAHLRASSEFALDLLEEAKLAVRIRHPNVVSVLDVGNDPNGIFLVMDYVEGDTLAALICRKISAGGWLEPAIGLRIVTDALAGLHAAHELCDEQGGSLNVVHRDFSPQNVLVGTDGMSQLADFGIAKAASRLAQTQTGNVKGKIGYMSPEQARGQPLDRRCDVWAAGVVAWEVLAGRRLYVGDNEVSLLLKIVSEPPPRLHEVCPQIPKPLSDAVASALTLPLAERCATAAELSSRIADACRRIGWSIAERAAVGAEVSRLAGPNLADRRRRMHKIIKLREGMRDALQRPADLLTPSSGVARAAVGPTRAPVPSGQDATSFANFGTISTTEEVLRLSRPRRTRRLIGGAFATAAFAAIGWLAMGGTEPTGANSTATDIASDAATPSAFTTTRSASASSSPTSAAQTPASAAVDEAAASRATASASSSAATPAPTAPKGARPPPTGPTTQVPPRVPSATPAPQPPPSSELLRQW